MKAAEIIEKVNELRQMVTDFIGEDIYMFDQIDAPTLANFESICDDINLELDDFETTRENETDQEDEE